MSLRRSSTVELLVSNRRSKQLAEGRASLIVSSFTSPPVWPPVLLCLLHNISMGAALMVWIDVCKAAYPAEQLQGDNAKSLPQRLYGRLLAVNAICELLTSNLVGITSDRYGRRLLQASAQLGQLIDYSAAALCLPSIGVLKWTVIPTHIVAPLLFLTRGLAGLLGNFRVALQSYTVDISSPEECPSNLAYIGAAMVVGMCIGSGMVAAVSSYDISLRACYLMSLLANFINLLLVKFVWRDVAPKRQFRCLDMNPFSGIGMMFRSRAMAIYSILVFLSSFALSIFTATLTWYCETILDMEKAEFTALGAEWACLSAIALSVVQPYLSSAFGEILTLRFSFFALTVFYVLFSFITARTWILTYVIIALFSLGSMAYPIAVGLASREVDAEQQGKLQGSLSVLENIAKITAPLIASEVLIPMFEKPGQFNGMVYLVAGLIVSPGILLTGQLQMCTTYMETTVESRDQARGSQIELPENNDDLVK